MIAFWNAVIFLALLSFVVIVHELGHFTVAKLCGIKVLEFAVGMGPLIFSVTRGETRYSLRMIPIGGFVSMLGENSDSYDEDGSEELEKQEQYERSFANKPPLQKLAVLLAGIFNNMIIGILLMMAYFVINGSVSNVIDAPIAGKPAELAGLMSGDKVVRINGEAVNSWYDVTKLISGSESASISVAVDRAGQFVEFGVTAEQSDDGRFIIGIMPLLQHDLLSSFRASFSAFGEMVVGTVKGFAGLFASGGQDIVGPIGLYRVVGEVREYGYTPMLMLAGSISISIGLVNLLPIPVLDGGRAVIVLGEMVTRRKLNRKVEGALMLAGIALIFMLMGFAFYNDIANILAGAK